jgi:hypothetical protein
MQDNPERVCQKFMEVLFVIISVKKKSIDMLSIGEV